VFTLNVRGQLSRGVAELAQAATGQDIMVFTETWLGEGQQAPDIAGYRSFQYNRPHALLSGQARGGLACYFRTELYDHVTHVSNDATNSFAVLKLSREVGFDQDLYLVVCYVPPRDTNSISIATRAVWAQLLDSVTAALAQGQVMIVGDLNARTGHLADFPATNPTDPHLQSGFSPTRAVRRSKDAGVNHHGHRLLEICHQTGLRIVNGRVPGDLDGSFTYVAPLVGASLIDYVVACPHAFGLVSRLSVVPAPCSDHLALQFDLTVSRPRALGGEPCDAPRVRRMQGPGNIKRWVEEALPAYASDLADIAGSAFAAAGQGRDAVHRLCTKLDEILLTSYTSVNPDCNLNPNPNANPNPNPNTGNDINVTLSSNAPPPSARRQVRWFDAELLRSRRAASAAMRRDPTSAEARQLRRDYQRLLQRRQRRFKRAQAAALVEAAVAMGKDFWRRFKPKQPVEPSISRGQWFSHFSALLGTAPNDGSPRPGDVHAPPAAQATRSADGSELNQPFTAADIVAGASMLRKGSSTLGFLSVEALRAAAALLAPAVAALFNACAQVGSLPPAWALCAVTPIHKGGARTEPGNYRGIAVGTVLAKMYATLLNFRLTNWAEANNLRAAGQAGFREDHRCTDNLLILRTVIEQQRAIKAPLYTCFVDLRKAYDSVPRELLWTKLERLGVHGCFLDGIKALYADVPMAIKTAQGLTANFQSVMGVKQGCPLSPTLFGLYLDDLEDTMRAEQHLLDSPSLSGLTLLALLYADDLALASTSLAGLQAQMDVLHGYALRWGLTVNVDKTKAVIYRAVRAPVCSNPTLMYDGKSIEFVDTFKYLGIDLHCTQSFSDAGLPRKESGQRALPAMLRRCRELGIDDPVLQVKLFDALVQPVMMYGVEIWGAGGVLKGELPGDLVHRTFLRSVLGVHTGTPNMALLAEAGRYPQQVFAAQMLLKYWNRLIRMDDDRLVKRAFVVSAALAGSTACNSRHTSWAGQAAAVLGSLGLPCNLAAPAVADVEKGVSTLQSRYLSSITDSESSKVQQYLRMRDGVVPETYCMAPYLKAVGGWRQRKALSQLRTGSHWLAVETGRRAGAAVPRDQRVCQRCSSGEVDDEAHMVFRCAALSVQRREHASLFTPWPDSLRSFMGRDPTTLAAFVFACCKRDKEMKTISRECMTLWA
jgi:hypothetical protein